MYVAGSQSSIDEALFFGLKPAILVIVLEALFRIGKTGASTWLMVALAVLASIATFFFNSVIRDRHHWRCAAWLCGRPVWDSRSSRRAGTRTPVGGGDTPAGQPRKNDLLDHTYPLLLAFWVLPLSGLLCGSFRLQALVCHIGFRERVQPGRRLVQQ